MERGPAEQEGAVPGVELFLELLVSELPLPCSTSVCSYGQYTLHLCRAKATVLTAILYTPHLCGLLESIAHYNTYYIRTLRSRRRHNTT